jgi:hypothetical protein
MNQKHRLVERDDLEFTDQKQLGVSRPDGATVWLYRGKDGVVRGSSVEEARRPKNQAPDADNLAVSDLWIAKATEAFERAFFSNAPYVDDYYIEMADDIASPQLRAALKVLQYDCHDGQVEAVFLRRDRSRGVVRVRPDGGEPAFHPFHIHGVNVTYRRSTQRWRSFGECTTPQTSTA